MLAAFDFRVLADVNAGLNLTSLIFLVIGLVAIKRGNESLHKRMMLTATGVSALFLTSYLVYHFTVDSVRYGGTGVMKVIYYAILIPHVILAVVMVPLILITLVHALRDRRARHRRIARITAPIWLFVSVTGVIYYVILYWL